MVATHYIGSFGKSIYSVEYQSFRGVLSSFQLTQTGLQPGSSYFVGYMFDSGNSDRGSMTANGYLINDSHTAGTGSWRKAAGISRIWVGQDGIITWTGGGTATVTGAFKTFTIRVV